jgi:hypothetical protein
MASSSISLITAAASNRAISAAAAAVVDAVDAGPDEVQLRLLRQVRSLVGYRGIARSSPARATAFKAAVGGYPRQLLTIAARQRRHDRLPLNALGVGAAERPLRRAVGNENEK